MGGAENDYFLLARKATGALLFVVGAFLALLDAFRIDFDINIWVLLILFGFGAALYGVAMPKLPQIGGDK